MAESQSATTEAPKAKTSRLTKTFVEPDGTETKRPTSQTTAVKLAVIGGESFLVEVAAVQAAGTFHQAACYGLSESLGNAGNPGKAAELRDRELGIESRRDVILGGDWQTGRESSGPPIRLLVKGLHRVWKDAGKEQDISVAQAVVDGMDAETKKATTKSPAIAKAIRKIKDEEAGKVTPEDKASVLDLIPQG